MEGEDPIYELMKGYLEVPGVLAAILVSDQGLVINSARSDSVDTDTISALVVDVVAAAQRFGQETGVGGLDTMTIEFEELNLLLAPFHADCMLTLVARPGTFGQPGESLV